MSSIRDGAGPEVWRLLFQDGYAANKLSTGTRDEVMPCSKV